MGYCKPQNERKQPRELNTEISQSISRISVVKFVMGVIGKFKVRPIAYLNLKFENLEHFQRYPDRQNGKNTKNIKMPTEISKVKLNIWAFQE